MATSNYMASLRWIAVLVLTLAAGCGDQDSSQQPQDNNHGYGYAYTESNNDGLRMRAYGVKPNLFSYYESAWADMLACTGLPATQPPLIIVVEANNADLTDPAGYGRTFIDTGTILTGAVTDETIRHAMLHVLLKGAGYDDTQNMSHVFHAGYMAQCGY